MWVWVCVCVCVWLWLCGCVICQGKCNEEVGTCECDTNYLKDSTKCSLCTCAGGTAVRKAVCDHVLLWLWL